MNRRDLYICASLILATLLVFSGVVRNDFIGLDDDPYVVQNPIVQQGLTVDGLIWAFTSVRNFYWHPLTWLSHMLVCQLFGLNAGWHHLANLVIHALNGVLLFLLLRRLTAAIYRSAAVAALFLLHPLRVESVAWVAERKDVLCAFFWLLTMLAYAHYAGSPKSWKRYALVVLLFVCALMSKPMVLPLPAILLVLDYWPLGRWQRRPGQSGVDAAWPLVREKLPLFGLAAAVGVATVIGQRDFIQMVADSRLSIAERLWNVPLTYLFYLFKSLWPHPLGLYYAYDAIPPWTGVLCWAAMAGISWFFWRQAATAPWLIVGWLWWVVAFLPTIWIPDRWDRFSYLPGIGLLLLMVWGVAELFALRKWPPRIAIAALAAILVAFGAISWIQTGFWRDRLTLYQHAVDVYDGNKLSQNNLGRLLLNLGVPQEAARHLERAVALDPKYAVGLKNLGNAYTRLGRYEQAAERFTQAIQIRPDYADANFDLAMVLQQLQRPADAQRAFEIALQSGLAPNVAARAYVQIGTILWQDQHREDALQRFLKAVELDRNWVEARKAYAAALLKTGREKEASEQWSYVLSISPGDVDAQRALEQIRLSSLR